jgi:hypothetical protein
MPDATQSIVTSGRSPAHSLSTPIQVEQTSDGARINLSGEDAELLVRHRGD